MNAERIRKIETLYWRAATPGERAAAEAALKRLGVTQMPTKEPEPQPAFRVRFKTPKPRPAPPLEYVKPPAQDVETWRTLGVVLRAQWSTFENIRRWSWLAYKGQLRKGATFDITREFDARIEKTLTRLKEARMISTGTIRGTLTPVFRLKGDAAA